MTHADIAKVAAALHTVRRDIHNSVNTTQAIRNARLYTVRQVEDQLMSVFRADKPTFDAKRFLLASGGRTPDKDRT